MATPAVERSSTPLTDFEALEADIRKRRDYAHTIDVFQAEKASTSGRRG
jgi:hypothetical protein